MRDAGPSRGRRQWRGRSGGVSNGERGRFRPGRGRSGHGDGHSYRGHRGHFGDGLPPSATGDSKSVLAFRRTTNGQTVPRDEQSTAPANGNGTTNGGPPDGFELFCAYHLGITPDERYQKPSLTDVARRFNMSPEEIKALLVQFKIDKETLDKSTFDLQGAQLDIRVAPEGISRRELARDHYEEYIQNLEN